MRSAPSLAVVALLGTVGLGCGGETEPGPPGTSGGEPGGCPAGEWQQDDGSCAPAGLPPDMPCPPGEWLRDDGSCIPAGVPPDGCGEGFVHDGDRGCEPILPAEPCPEGLMAVPGDTACREVAACGSGTWGDIPVEGNTEHVDASYVGGNSDGTALAPWTNIQDAIDAAAPGAIVAVAAGSYVEDVTIQGKPVRLWGRCPAMVELVGTDSGLAAVLIRTGASGSEVRSLAIAGDAIGVALFGSENVVVDRVWVHDTVSRGIDVEDEFGPTSVTVSGSLVEHSHQLALFFMGVEATVEGTVVRETLPDAPGLLGRGVSAQSSPSTGEPSTLTLRGSLVEQSHQVGVFIWGSVALVEATVVRDTLPLAEGGFSWGVAPGIDRTTGAPSALLLRRSLVEQSRGAGVAVDGSVAVVESTVIRDTLQNTEGFGFGVTATAEPTNVAPSALTLRGSLVERSVFSGVEIHGSEAIIEATTVRNTSASTLNWSAGVSVAPGANTGAPSALRLTGSLVEKNRMLGLYVGGSVAFVEATVIRDTLPDADRVGRGVTAYPNPNTGAPSYLSLRRSLVERSHEVGVYVSGSEALVEATVIRDTLPHARGRGRGVHAQPYLDAGESIVSLAGVLVEHSIEAGVMVGGPGAITLDGCLVRDTVPNGYNALGDGIVVFSYQGPADAFVTNTRVANSARAAISSFGGQITIGGSALSCQMFDLAGNPFLDFDYAYHDLGDNLCGCPEADGECIIDSATMEAPEPVGGLE